MEGRRHHVRLTLALSAFEHYSLGLIGLKCLDHLEQVNGRISVSSPPSPVG